MIKYILLLIFGLGYLGIQAQLFSTLSADFSILEKNTLKDTSFLVIGSLTYDLSEDLTTYNVTFPERKTWKFSGVQLTVYDSLGKIEKVDSIGMVSELSIFKKILKDDLSDFGLEEAGFTITEIQKDGRAVIMQWKPPAHMSFIKNILSREEKGNLTGIIVIDEYGKEINKTFYQEYILVGNIPVPTKIKSHFKGKEEQIYKELQLRGVEIY